MRLIVLAAGDAFALDGFNKLSIRHPVSRRSILELYREHFPVDGITIVVGYRAIEIMNDYPDFDYVWNQKWRTTLNAYSLGLALDDEPCFVASSDYFVSAATIAQFEGHANAALVADSDSRTATSLNCSVRDGGCLDSVYRGESRRGDPELLGLFKITDAAILRRWKRSCLTHGNLFIGETLPTNEGSCVQAIEQSQGEFVEVNDPADYIHFLARCRDGGLNPESSGDG